MYQSKLTSLYLTQMILFFVSVVWWVPDGSRAYFLLQYGVFFLICLFSEKAKSGLALLATYLFSSITLYLILSFMYHWPVSIQIEKIIAHGVGVINLTLLYMTVSAYREVQDENQELQTQVSKLMFQGSIPILSKTEFEARSVLIIKSMERRKECGYKMFFKLPLKSYASESLFNTLSKVASQVFKQNFDLIGRTESNEFCVLFQNMDPEFKKEALERYFVKLQEELLVDPMSDLEIREEFIDFRSREGNCVA